MTPPPGIVEAEERFPQALQAILVIIIGVGAFEIKVKLKLPVLLIEKFLQIKAPPPKTQ